MRAFFHWRKPPSSTTTTDIPMVQIAEDRDIVIDSTSASSTTLKSTSPHSERSTSTTLVESAPTIATFNAENDYVDISPSTTLPFSSVSSTAALASLSTTSILRTDSPEKEVKSTLTLPKLRRRTKHVLQGDLIGVRNYSYPNTRRISVSSGSASRMFAFDLVPMMVLHYLVNSA